MALQIDTAAQRNTGASGASDTNSLASQQFSNANLWWNYFWPYRATVTLKSGGFDRTDLVIEKHVNLASLFNLSKGRTPNTDTVRCHEVNGSGALLTLDIPCQFDPDSSGTAGNLILMANGATAAGTQRYFHSYFSQNAPNSSSQADIIVNSKNITTSENRAGIEINTPGGRYEYVKNAGALSNLLDIDGNDWIGYQGDSQSNKSLRGIPNLSTEKGYFQLWATNNNTKTTHQGPIKTTIESTTADENWKTRWEFYPQHAALTVLAADSKFQFTYSGTPSGIENLNSGNTTKADGSSKPLTSNWIEDLIGEEWIHLSRGNRTLVLVKDEDDTVPEAYTAIDRQTAQFRFGMQTPESGGIGSYVWSRYLISLRETTSFKDIQSWVDSTVEPVEVTISSPAVVQ